MKDHITDKVCSDAGVNLRAIPKHSVQHEPERKASAPKAQAKAK